MGGSTNPTGATFRQATTSKVFRRFMPFLMLCFFIAFVYWVGISVAAVQMNENLGLSAAAFGLGTGVFFVGYVIFEVPSNLVLARVGAREPRPSPRCGARAGCVLSVPARHRPPVPRARAGRPYAKKEDHAPGSDLREIPRRDGP